MWSIDLLFSLLKNNSYSHIFSGESSLLQWTQKVKRNNKGNGVRVRERGREGEERRKQEGREGGREEDIPSGSPSLILSSNVLIPEGEKLSLF